MPFSSIRSSFLGSLLPGKGVDSQLRFSVSPPATESGFSEWREAMRAVARLPGGVPEHFRPNLWCTLASQHINSLGIDWKEVCQLAFSERMLPEDHLLTAQIIKDVHRTGCAGFEADEDRVRLKRVLLGYARYNKEIGYCQGFNIIAALVLQVVQHRTDDALKIMIFLVEQVLPRGYFDQSLRALSVDMAVLRDLMAIRLTRTVTHLDNLQANSGNEYEPVLTNVFSMHWFLTLFATLLPRSAVYRIWDAIMLEGSEVLLRTAVAIWSKIGVQVVKTQSADEFYGLMGGVCKQLSELRSRDEDDLLTVIYTMSEFPYPGLAEMREKYTWNIQPLSSTFKLFQKSVTHILHDDSVDQDATSCLGGCENGTRRLAGSSPSSSSLSPSAGPSRAELAELQKQYKLLRQRQKQASLILQAAYQHGQSSHGGGARGGNRRGPGDRAPLPEVFAPSMFNHLYMGETLLARAHINKLEGPSTMSAGGALALTPTIIQPVSHGRLVGRAAGNRGRSERDSETESSLAEWRVDNGQTEKNDLDDTGMEKGRTRSSCSSAEMPFSDEESEADSDGCTIRDGSRPASRRESEAPKTELADDFERSMSLPFSSSKDNEISGPEPTAQSLAAVQKMDKKKAMMKKSLAMLDSMGTSRPQPTLLNPFNRPQLKTQ